MSVKRVIPRLGGLSILCASLLLTAACSTTEPQGLDPDRQAFALREVKELQAKGQRVWCVPFARNASGIDIRGNAETWWNQAKGLYDQGREPEVGAVMAFKSTRSMPMGHVAVVSKVLSAREVLIDHANWHRNQVSLNMAVVDVSEKNDWSAVRLQSNPDSFGSVYPVNGFIYPVIAQ
ncbi:CHAP domain-containing protein [Albibacillus kandeliae]|uniref:CHAP domain-containing protein n=1 Tax=Albibacillus kandeliae TaxID=2174228 RepID=UPI000D68E72C|nr:CHAP domain-containing protein [Albibacillus kandeliae]